MKLACVWLLVFVVGSTAVGQPDVSNDKVEIIGNRRFSNSELESVARKCLAAYSASGQAAEPSRFHYCSSRIKVFLINRGYLQATVVDHVTSVSATTSRITFTVHEGALFRLGRLQLRGATLFSSNTLLDMFRLKPGDVVTGEALDNALYDQIETAYWNLGYIDYFAVVDPTFGLKAGANEGVVDLLITIDEGPAFAVGLVAFTGVDKERAGRLAERMLIKRGEMFSRERFRAGLEQINQTGEFEVIDADKDVDYQRDRKSSSVDIVVHLKRRGAVKNVNGVLMRQPSVLDTRISLPVRERSDLQMLDAICEAISKEKHLRLAVATVPTNLFLQNHTTVGFSNEKAPNVLIRFLQT